MWRIFVLRQKEPVLCPYTDISMNTFLYEKMVLNIFDCLFGKLQLLSKSSWIWFLGRAVLFGFSISNL